MHILVLVLATPYYHYVTIYVLSYVLLSIDTFVYYGISSWTDPSLPSFLIRLLRMYT